MGPGLQPRMRITRGESFVTCGRTFIFFSRSDEVISAPCSVSEERYRFFLRKQTVTKTKDNKATLAPSST